MKAELIKLIESIDDERILKFLFDFVCEFKRLWLG